MRARVAVATVRGKAYYLIVNELKERGIHFLSLLPGEPIPIEIKAVITTPAESHVVNHSHLLVFNPETDPQALGSEVVKILRGKENYEEIVIGVDPGKVIGIALVADGAVIETENSFSVQEAVQNIQALLRGVDFSRTAVTVKVGSGVPMYRKLTEAMDQELPPVVALEVVGEAGTARVNHEAKNRRVFRHMVSAERIARRQGCMYERRRTLEQDS
jgi:hypothetical protein